MPVPAGARNSLRKVLRRDWTLHRHKIHSGHAGPGKRTKFITASLNIAAAMLLFLCLINLKHTSVVTVYRQAGERQTHPLPQQAHPQQGKLYL